jgi:hypothetical protein
MIRPGGHRCRVFSQPPVIFPKFLTDRRRQCWYREEGHCVKEGHIMQKTVARLLEIKGEGVWSITPDATASACWRKRELAPWWC